MGIFRIAQPTVLQFRQLDSAGVQERLNESTLKYLSVTGFEYSAADGTGSAWQQHNFLVAL